MGIRLEVIQFNDEQNTSVVQRIPPDGTADIKYGAQLIVNASQEAVFFRDGQAMDQFGPGRHTLKTNNVPIITRILTIPWEKSPFQACVYYIGKQTFIDQKWGTRQPITFRDRDFGVVRLRSFGKYSFRVADASLLLNTLVGSQGKFTTEEITSYQKDIIVSRLTDLLGTAGVSLLDMAARYDEIGRAARDAVAADFAKFGLELVDLFINAITPPDEVQAAIDARSAMGIVGDMNSYVKYQTAQSINKMAQQGGGANNLGFGMGMMMPGMMQTGMGGTQGSVQYSPPQLSPPTSGGNIPVQGTNVNIEQNAGAAIAGSAGPAITGKPSFDQLAPAVAYPRELVKQIAASNNYTLTASAEELTIVVPIGTLRKQKVFVRFGTKDEQGNELVTFHSVCGQYTDKNASTLLRLNTKLAYGAFAVENVGASEAVVLRSNVLAEQLNAVAVNQILSAIAWQADQAEEKLSGIDEN